MNSSMPMPCRGLLPTRQHLLTSACQMPTHSHQLSTSMPMRCPALCYNFLPMPRVQMFYMPMLRSLQLPMPDHIPERPHTMPNLVLSTPDPRNGRAHVMRDRRTPKPAVCFIPPSLLVYGASAAVSARGTSPCGIWLTHHIYDIWGLQSLGWPLPRTGLGSGA